MRQVFKNDATAAQQTANSLQLFTKWPLPYSLNTPTSLSHPQLDSIRCGFINRSSELCLKYNCKYDYQRAKFEDPEHLSAYAGFSVCKIQLRNMKLRCQINITLMKSVSKWASFLLQRWLLHHIGLADHAQHSQEIANGLE